MYIKNSNSVKYKKIINEDVVREKFTTEDGIINYSKILNAHGINDENNKKDDKCEKIKLENTSITHTSHYTPQIEEIVVSNNSYLNINIDANLDSNFNQSSFISDLPLPVPNFNLLPEIMQTEVASIKNNLNSPETSNNPVELRVVTNRKITKSLFNRFNLEIDNDLNILQNPAEPTISQDLPILGDQPDF